MNELVRGRVTDIDKYIPTPAEAKLLEVISLPENAKKSVTDKCKMAGISRQTYYLIMKRNEFKYLVKDTALDFIKAEIVSLVNVGIDAAKDGSFQHWKVLLEMAGMHTDKVDTNVSVTFEQLLKKALESGE